MPTQHQVLLSVISPDVAAVLLMLDVDDDQLLG